MKKLLFLSTLLGLIFSVTTQTLANEKKVTTGYSAITTENYDEWDKKNSAVYDAMKNLTYSLATKIMSEEEIENSKELIDRKVVPSSNMYILNTEVLSHGVERDGELESYQAQVNFTYSTANFKKLLNSKGVLFQNFVEPKVAAFIEVKDEDNLQIYKWWEEQSPKLHPALAPIHARLERALKEQGYEMVSLKKYNSSNPLSPKSMAEKAGAHYYINGEILVSKTSPKSLKLKNGEFYFHETMSQKLVSKMNVMDFKKAYQKTLTRPPVVQREIASLNKSSRGPASISSRGPASVEDSEKAPTQPLPSDLLTDSFRKAVRTMNVVGDPESLAQGLTLITVKGVKNPLELQKVKDSFSALAFKGLDKFVERSITPGEVTFIARSKQSINSLKSLIERKTPLTKGTISASKDRNLIFEYGYARN